MHGFPGGGLARSLCVQNKMKMNYLITTNYYPKNDYDIGNGQFIKIVKNPYYNFKEVNKRNLNILNGTVWKYSLVIPDFYQHRNDLILFHAFITNINETYLYAENANKLWFKNDELEFFNDRNLIKKTGGYIKIVDFNKFPLLMTCNRIPESEMKFKYVNYKASFEKFLELKNRQVKGLSGKYNLYDLICLYEFARNFEITHRMYRNANLPLSFYITILESLIGKPEICNTKLHCDVCGADIQEHKKISLEKRKWGHILGEWCHILNSE